MKPYFPKTRILKANRVLNKLGVGQIHFVKTLLDLFNLPFQETAIKRMVDFDDKTEAFEVKLDNDRIISEHENHGKHIPHFLYDGEITIRISLKK